MVLAGETRRALVTALGALRDAEREVIGARYLLGLSEVETSEALGIPAGTVKSRTSRALAHLRQALESANDEAGASAGVGAGGRVDG